MGLDARRFTALAILVLATPWIVRFYARNERLGTVPETIAAGVTAFAIVDGGTLDVTGYFPRQADRPDVHYAVHFTPAGAYGIEPVASSLTFAPFFLPYRGTGAIHMQWRLFHRIAARVTTLTMLVLALWLLQITTLPRALLVTAIIALGTSIRTINAGGLWQHTSAGLWAVTGLALWTATAHR
ncbi:MAG TPA: hypothetical protein VFC77_07620, partial [Myxococcota bacterium]|nr:hypothetical protein [Myxococcota bacterium]